MTHVYESTFHQRAHEWLAATYGAANVHHEVYIATADHTVYVDFIVEAALTTWAIEVERSAAKVREGVGQAQEYAAAVRAAGRYPRPVTPAVLVPDGHAAGEDWARPLLTVAEAPAFEDDQ